jgi:hypothetical protein
MNSRTQRTGGGYRALSFQAEYIQENFRISGACILVMHGESSVFLAMLQKVLPRCVVAGPPGEPKSAPRRAGPSPGAFESGGARSPMHDPGPVGSGCLIPAG